LLLPPTLSSATAAFDASSAAATIWTVVALFASAFASAAAAPIDAAFVTGLWPVVWLLLNLVCCFAAAFFYEIS
jgi:hypothetical protein